MTLMQTDRNGPQVLRNLHKALEQMESLLTAHLIAVLLDARRTLYHVSSLSGAESEVPSTLRATRLSLSNGHGVTICTSIPDSLQAAQ